MSKKAEQAMELEGLRSIYGDDLVESTAKKFRIRLKPNCADGDTAHLTATLSIQYPLKYPDVLPTFEVTEITGFEGAEKDELTALIKGVAEANLGNPMVFLMATTMTEWLTEHNDVMLQRLKTEAAQRAQEEEAEEARRRKEEAIAALRIHGTPVTPQNFREWKEKFDLEALARLKGTKKLAAGVLTGKQLFLKNATLFSVGDEVVEGEADIAVELLRNRQPVEFEDKAKEEVVVVQADLFDDDDD
eukprot:TRINITY_DN19344_c0_g1_i1.p1 TRINITY_DN19344_c0_g1~~TRINITY_DN19344_c0_g1_i1.p1  ORF type:complete len:246 (-),score=80.39 TRINITY_DN19344_c0_g1_i1:8-745(-)